MSQSSEKEWQAEVRTKLAALGVRHRGPLAWLLALGTAGPAAWMAPQGSEAPFVFFTYALMVAPLLGIALLFWLGRHVGDPLLIELELTQLTRRQIREGLTAPVWRAYRVLTATWTLAAFGIAADRIVENDPSKYLVLVVLAISLVLGYWLGCWAVLFRLWLERPKNVMRLSFLGLARITAYTAITMAATAATVWLAGAQQDEETAWRFGLVPLLLIPLAKLRETYRLADDCLFSRIDAERIVGEVPEPPPFRPIFGASFWRAFALAVGLALLVAALCSAAAALGVRPAGFRTANFFLRSLGSNWVIVAMAMTLPALLAWNLARAGQGRMVLPAHHSRIVVAGHALPLVAALGVVALAQAGYEAGRIGLQGIASSVATWSLASIGAGAVFVSLLPNARRGRWIVFWVAAGFVSQAWMTLQTRASLAVAWPALTSQGEFGVAANILVGALAAAFGFGGLSRHRREDEVAVDSTGQSM